MVLNVLAVKHVSMLHPDLVVWSLVDLEQITICQFHLITPIVIIVYKHAMGGILTLKGVLGPAGGDDLSIVKKI
jgi:hypothetical protein